MGMLIFCFWFLSTLYCYTHCKYYLLILIYISVLFLFLVLKTEVCTGWVTPCCADKRSSILCFPSPASVNMGPLRWDPSSAAFSLHCLASLLWLTILVGPHFGWQSERPWNCWMRPCEVAMFAGQMSNVSLLVCVHPASRTYQTQAQVCVVWNQPLAFTRNCVRRFNMLLNPMKIFLSLCFFKFHCNVWVCTCGPSLFGTLGFLFCFFFPFLLKSSIAVSV